MLRFKKLFFLITFLTILPVLSSCENSTKSEGGNGESCYSDGTCDDGLTCDPKTDTCLENSGDTGNTGDSADTGNTSDTGNTGNTGSDSGNTGDTGNSGSDDNETPDWDENDATWIYLEGDSIRVEGTGASADGSIATITDAGVFYVTGTLNDGQVLVDTASEELVGIVLENATITSSTNSPLAIMNAKDVTILLNENSANTLNDASAYVFEGETDEPDAALFSSSDLVISGNGSLVVNGNYNDGISGKDDLKITGGTIIINAVDDGIRGKDSVEIKGGNITINSLGDGLKSDNEEDTSRGYILIEDGIFNISSGKDGMDAFTNVTISGGSFNIDSSDDCIHSNGDVVIDGGNFVLASGDDGMHSDTNLTINGGDISVTKSYEGLEALTITVNDGTIHIVSSDDGVNCAGGDGSANEGPGGGPQPVTGNFYLYINGGYIWMNAGGDGLDSNGNVEMTGGTAIVNGPTNNGNGALDIGDGQSNYFKITGGILIAAGSSGMAIGPDTVSTQNSVLYNFTSISANTLFHVRNSSGEKIFTFAPMKQYASVAFSMPGLSTGQSYEVYSGGTDTGTETDGLYEGGTYNPGTKLTTFTISGVSTKIGSGGHP